MPNPVTSSPSSSSYVSFDTVLGAVVMGTVGFLLGMAMEVELVPITVSLGVLLGTGVGLLKGRRFLISILVGTVLGGVLAVFLAGPERVYVGAGAGAAMGGFLGVWVSMLLDWRAANKQTQEGEAQA